MNTTNTIMTATDRLPAEYTEALALHNKILANGQIAAQAIVDFSLELKEMRDKKLYSALGHESFDDYVENAVGLKKRQAYNYIRAVERLGIESMTEHAHLGITKLQLIANVASEEREEFISSHQVEDMSTKQLEDAIAELHKAKEQISFLEDELRAVQSKTIEDGNVADDSSEIRAEYNSMLREYDALKAEVEERKNTEKEAINKAKAQAEEKTLKALAKAKEEHEEAIKKSKAEGIEEATTAIKSSLTALEKEKSEALAKAEALEKQLAVSNNQSSLMVAFLFEQIGDAVRKIATEIQNMDQETRSKYSEAVSRFLAEQSQQLS